MRNPHYLHFIDQAGLSVWARQDETLSCVQRFTGDEAGLAAFEAWLGPNARALHTLLVDLPDEGFHLERIPPVSGQDRKQLIERRRLQLFQASPFSTAISLGHEKEGRRDERVLLVGLNRPPALAPWMQIFRKTEARLCRLCSTALLVRKLIRLLKPDSPRGLILSLSDTGIRQTFFEQGELRFSRLSPPPEDDFPAWGFDCLKEAQKTAQYLVAQLCLDRETHLPVYLLAHREDFHAMMQDLADPPPLEIPLEFRLAELEGISTLAGFKAKLEDSDSLPLMMHLALQDKGPVQLAPEEGRLSYRRSRLKNAVLGLGLAASVGIGALSALNYREAMVLKSRAETLESSFREDQASYDRLLAKLPKTQASLAVIQTTVESYISLKQGRPAPGETLKRISHALDLHPDIALKGLEWQIPVHSKGEGKKAPGSFLIDASWTGKKAQAQTIIAGVEAFARELEKQAGGRSQLLDKPFDASPDKTLHSEALDQASSPVFRIRLNITG